MVRITKEKDFTDYLQEFDNSISTPEKMQKYFEETEINIIESTINYIKLDFNKYKQEFKK
jgi:hypothetical protein